MPQASQKGIAHILLLVLLVAGIGLGVYLVNQKTNLFPWAASNPIPPTCPVSGPCPSASAVADGDSDSDGFTNGQEIFMGTNLNKACPTSPTDHAWPVDTNNNTVVNGGDVSQLVPYISGERPYDRRYDLNQDGAITQAGDVPVIQAHFFETCTPISGAGYSLEHSQGNLDIGDNFVVDLVVDTNGQPANTFEAVLKFDPSKLEVVGIDMENFPGAFITQVDDIYFQNFNGEIILIGGLPTPGFTSSLVGDVMAKLTFKVKSTGQTTISIDNGSKVITDDTNDDIFVSGLDLNLNLGPAPTPPPSQSPSATPSFLPSPTPALEPSVAPSFLPSPSPLQACIINKVEWISNSNPVKAGDIVTLEVTGADGCTGQTVKFVIGEDDGPMGADGVVINPVNANFGSNNIATTSWVAEFQQDGFNGFNNPPEYFFTASLEGSTSFLTISPDKQLKVNNLREGEFLNGDGNRDGKVDTKDLAVLRKWWGKTGFPQEIDIDDNGVLNTFDLAGLRKILEISGIIRTRTN